MQASPRVVVIVPTRELARQVGSQWKKLAPKSLHCEVVYGGVPLERHQSNLQKQPVQVRPAWAFVRLLHMPCPPFPTPKPTDALRRPPAKSDAHHRGRSWWPPLAACLT